MKIKSEKGFTGIDIAISVIVLFIFVSLIAILSYNFNSSSKEIQLKSQATDLAIEAIEEMKNKGFSEVENLSERGGNSQYFPTDKTKDSEETSSGSGYYKTIIVQDYNDIKPEKIPGLVKKVTVKIKYMFKAKEQSVELSTILSKES